MKKDKNTETTFETLENLQEKALRYAQKSTINEPDIIC